MKQINIKHLIMAFVISISAFAQAQTGFFTKTQGTNPENRPYDFAVKPDNLILFINNSVTNSYIFTNELYELNPNGEILDVKIFTDSLSNNVIYTNIFVIEDTVYILGWGEKIETKGNPFLIFKSFDLQLNILKDIKLWVDLPNYQNLMNRGQAKYIGDHFYYIASAGYNTSMKPFLAEISKKGELIKVNQDSTAGYYNVVYDFIKKPDNSGFQLHSMRYAQEKWPDDGYILNYDNDLNFESYIHLPNNFMWYFTNLSYNDSVFFLAGMRMDITYEIPYHAGLLKMKTNGTVINEFNYYTYPDTTSNPAYHKAIDTLPDGNLIFCFTDNIKYQMTPQEWPAKINLMKLTPDLELIWHRYIGEENAKNDAFVMRTTPDGEIVIFAAWSPVPPPNNYYTEPLFIKTDSEGLITGISEELQGIRSSEAILYPNPAKDFVHIEYSLAYSAAMFSLADINGKTVLEKQLTSHRESVDISALNAGTYVYRIYNKKGLDERGKIVVE